MFFPSLPVAYAKAVQCLGWDFLMLRVYMTIFNDVMLPGVEEAELGTVQACRLEIIYKKEGKFNKNNKEDVSQCNGIRWTY